MIIIIARNYHCYPAKSSHYSRSTHAISMRMRMCLYLYYICIYHHIIITVEYAAIDKDDKVKFLSFLAYDTRLAISQYEF